MIVYLGTQLREKANRNDVFRLQCSPIIRSKRTIFGTFGVFSGAHIRHDHKQYCLSSSDPAGKDIWAGLFMVEIFLFPIGEALPKTQQTRESSAIAKLTPIGRRPPPH